MSRKSESVTGHEYSNEYMIVLQMMASSTGDGSRKIRSVKEFVDSKASHEFFPAENQRRKEVQAAQARLDAEMAAVKAKSKSHSRR
jgi:hypothetical protein